MSITLFKHALGTGNAKFICWNSDASLRKFFYHGFRGVTTPRYYVTAHFLGFVAAGSIPWLSPRA